MTTQRIAMLAGLLGLAVGTGITYVAVRPPAVAVLSQSGSRSSPKPTPSEHGVTLSSEAVARAGITVARAMTGGGVAQIRLPATVTANAYHQATVTALVPGRLTSVRAELGQAIHRGDVLAVLYSPDLADAKRIYLSAKAELEAHELQLTRATNLERVGAASRQKVEQAHAEHTVLITTVEGARSRLQLLGLTENQIDDLSSATPMTSSIDVRAPIDGVVITRAANVGVNVELAASLFTIADLSTVWIVGDLFEKDFQPAGIGRSVAIRIAGYPETPLHSTISYIDPQLNAETRTARVRAEIANPRRELRLGMFAEMTIDSSVDAAMTMIPREALQTIGDHTVVYVPDASMPNRFVERLVEPGAVIGDHVAIKSGLEPNEPVVVTGTYQSRIGLTVDRTKPVGCALASRAPRLGRCKREWQMLPQ